MCVFSNLSHVEDTWQSASAASARVNRSDCYQGARRAGQHSLSFLQLPLQVSNKRKRLNDRKTHFEAFCLRVAQQQVSLVA